jgi:hypothetical protein
LLSIQRRKPVKQIRKFAALSVVPALFLGSAYAQNMPTPKPEDAEKNAFQTPTAGDKGKTDSSDNTRQAHPGANPESRMNDDPPGHEKVGAPNSQAK